MTDDPTDRLADTRISIELTIGDVVMAAVAAQCCEQIGRQRAGAGAVGPAFYRELKDRLYAATAEGMEAIELGPAECERVIEELKAEIAIFQMPDH